MGMNGYVRVEVQGMYCLGIVTLSDSRDGSWALMLLRC